MEHSVLSLSQSSPLVNTEKLHISTPLRIANKQSAFPDLCIDSTDALWVTWLQSDGNLESIRAMRFVDKESRAPLEISESDGICLQPCAVSLGHGSVRFFWVHHSDSGWQLLTRSAHGNTLGDVVMVLENEHGLFRPRATIDREGICWVAFECVKDGRTCVKVCRQSGNSWCGAFESTGAFDRRPDLCSVLNGDIYLVFDARTGPSSSIVARRFESGRPTESPEEIVICNDGYINVHPTIARDNDSGVWIGFASNRNEATSNPEYLTKWSYVNHLDGKQLTEPAAHRTGIDIYNEHAFQGWEFPSIALTSSGVLAMAGQSAHSLVFQYCSDNSWSDVINLDEPHWGSWKPRTRMVSHGDTIYAVSMGLGGVQISEITLEAATHPVQTVKRIHAKAPAETSTSIDRVTANRPTLSDGQGTELSYFFGDLHGHSVYSDAAGDVDEFYHRYKDIYGYDFAALTEHDYLDGIELSKSELALLWNNASRFSSDGEFIAWYAYEWTSPAISVHAGPDDPVGEGHRHVLYPDEAGPLVRYGDPASNTGKKLLEQLNGTKALVIPHHTAWSGTDWDAHDPELQRLVEVVSTHGRFEFGGNHPIGYRRDHIHQRKFVLDALDRGYRLGFVGGSDSHGLRWHAIELDGRADHIREGTRVGWKEDAYRTGMTVILASELTRSSLFEALHARRCYATSGVPIVLDFRVNGFMMGSEVKTDTAPELSVSVDAVGALRSVEIIRSGQSLTGLQGLPGAPVPECSFEFVDESLIPGESVYYYLRVIREDGNMAWSSPIWVTYE